MNIQSLIEAMRAVPDHRRTNTVHPLASILAMCVCAMLCGAKHPYAIWQWGREQSAEVIARLGFRREQTPSKGVLYKVLAELNVDAFERALARFLAFLESEYVADEYVAGRRGASIDGKTLRGTLGYDEAPGLALVALYAHRTGRVLAQVPVEAHGELGAVREILEATPLADLVVTGDALQTQRDISKMIVEKKGSTFSRSKAISHRSRQPSSPSSSARPKHARKPAHARSGTVASKGAR